MKLTYELLTALFNCNAPNAPQAGFFKLQYPLKSGWMEDIIGTEISEDHYKWLLEIKGERPSGMPRAKWRTLHKFV